MTKQLLIYETAVPISSQKHRDYSVAPTNSFDFARDLNAVPLVASETPIAAREFAIVFAGDGTTMVPTAILGVSGTNAFVDEAGAWTGRYSPAFLRRYPFVFSRTEGADTYSLCIDEAYPGLNSEGRGERMFDSEGARTQYLNTVLEFATRYQREFDATLAYVKRLTDLDLFEPAQATINLPDGTSTSLQGFSRVNRTKLHQLPDETLGELVRSGLMEFCHAHLASLANVTPMAEKLASRAAPPQDAAPEAAADDETAAD